MREVVFVVIAISILGTLLWLCYASKYKRFPTMFAVALLSLLAFYLFQYGNLSSFSLKALSAEAKFIKEKRQEVTQDAQAIAEIKERLEKLLTESQASQQEIEKAKMEILTLQKQIKETADLASPPALELTAQNIQPVESGYKLTLQFTPSKNVPLGIIVFLANIQSDDASIHILNFWPSIEGGAFGTGEDSKQIEADGKQASLSYSLFSVGRPTIELTISGHVLVTITGNYLKDPVEIRTD